MSQSPKISLCIIVKNEEKYLRECLQSVKDVVDEIILVDTGSTDNTINIAEEFNAKIYHFNWINDFSAARNFALSKSTGNWILYLDADERLSDKSSSELKNIISQNDLLGYRCIVNSISNNGKSNIMRYTRLFHNSPNIKFSGKVHEQIDDSLLDNGYKILDTCIEIIHIGYNISNDVLKEKAQRNLNILKDEFEKNNSSYNAYQLANTYSALEDYEEANKYYKLSVNRNDLNKEYKAFAYLNLSGYEYKNHNLNKAIDFLEKGLQHDRLSPLLNLLAAEIFFRMNRPDDSLIFCKRAVEGNKNILSGKYASSFSVTLKNETILSKGINYSILSSSENELQYFISELEKENVKLSKLVKVLINNENISESGKNGISQLLSNENLDMFLTLFERYNDKRSALGILKSVYNSFKKNSKYLKTLGILYSENNLPGEAIKLFEESLTLQEKDPASVFYLVSAYLQNNQIEKIPDLLILAEKEFSNIPEFNTRFEILKQKLSAIFETQSTQKL